MSWATKRAEIAAAASTVSGVHGYPHRPATPTTGDAWPRVDSIARDDGLFRVTWQLLVFLPQEERAAATWWDENVDALIDALQEGQVGYVETVQPADISTNGAVQYGLAITMGSE